MSGPEGTFQDASGVIERAKHGEATVEKVKLILREERPGQRHPDHTALVAIRRAQRKLARQEQISTISSMLLNRNRVGLAPAKIRRLEREHGRLREAISREESFEEARFRARLGRS